jgi:hypothetical protein
MNSFLNKVTFAHQVRRVWIVTVAIGIAATVQAQLPTRTETFDTGPGLFSSTFGNNEQGNSFDFSNSNNTLGASAAGEIGGTFSRQSFWNYIGDTNFPEPLNRTQTFEMSGELIITQNIGADGTLALGWFNTVTTGSQATGADFLGITIAEPNAATNGRFRLALSAISSTGTFTSSGVFQLEIGVPIEFSLIYSGNPSGGGIFTGTVGTAALTLNAPNSPATLFDGFGFGTGFNSTEDELLQVMAYVDNLLYTVPEPSSAFLCCAGFVFLMQRRSLRRRAQ